MRRTSTSRGLFEYDFYLLARDAGEVIEKIYKCGAGTKIIEEVPYWYAGAIEAWGAAHSIWIHPHDAEEWVAGRDGIAFEVFGVHRTGGIGGM